MKQFASGTAAKATGAIQHRNIYWSLNRLRADLSFAQIDGRFIFIVACFKILIL
jgi:hypothetical protein